MGGVGREVIEVEEEIERTRQVERGITKRETDVDVRKQERKREKNAKSTDKVTKTEGVGRDVVWVEHGNCHRIQVELVIYVFCMLITRWQCPWGRGREQE